MTSDLGSVKSQGYDILTEIMAELVDAWNAVSFGLADDAALRLELKGKKWTAAARVVLGRLPSGQGVRHWMPDAAASGFSVARRVADAARGYLDEYTACTVGCYDYVDVAQPWSNAGVSSEREL